VAEAIERQGQRLLDRVFSAAEQQMAVTSRERDRFYAARFAAKEACLKALGTGVTERVRWIDIEILDHVDGVPQLKLSGGGYRRMRRIVGVGNVGHLHLSLSDDGDYALAFDVLERRRVGETRARGSKLQLATK
jgi:holo-[acyl-carrier protein] synthase